MFSRSVHPGEILKDELEELGVTQAAFARQIEVPPNRVSQIIAGKRSVTGDTALRFGHWFGVEPQFWLNLQSQFDLATAERRNGAEIKALPKAVREKRRGGRGTGGLLSISSESHPPLILRRAQHERPH